MRKRNVPVIDVEIRERFSSLTAAANALGVAVASLSEAVSARRPCKGRRFEYDLPVARCACCKSLLTQYAA